MTTLRTAAQQALEALEEIADEVFSPYDNELGDAILALRAALAQQDEPVTEDMKSAVRWAPSSAYWSQQLRGLFGPDAREGIDALERRLAEAQQAEPHPDYPCRSDGRCQYAIDHGAEGLGSCPKGKCAIAQPQPAEDRAVAQDNLRVMREMFGEQDEPVQEQAEPVAWLQPKNVDGYSRPDLGYETCSRGDYGAFPVYTPPPQRQPLTEEEIVDAVREADLDWQKGWTLDETQSNRFVTLARAIERAHGIGEQP